MTLLVISPDYASHLLPLATIATAWQLAGERVVVATGPANAGLVGEFGYERVDLRLGRGSNPGIIKIEDQPRGEDDNLRAFFDATRRGMIETLRYQADARCTDLLWNPVTSARRVIDIVDKVGPDEILVDHLAFAATLGLQASGIPYSDVVLGHPTALPVGDEVYGSLTDWPTCFDPEADELDELRRRCRSVSDRFTDDWNQASCKINAGGRQVDDAFAVHGQHVMFNYPAELHDPRRQVVVSEQIGPHTFLGASIRADVVDPDVAKWLQQVGTRPVVYVSFGSFLSARADVLANVAGALARLDVDVMLATGSATLSDLGELPDRWLIRAYLPQITCLAHTDLAITHGGNNSVTECLYHGVPMIVLPFSTDQFAGAAAIERHGSGVVLDSNACSIAHLDAAINRVLTGAQVAIATSLGNRLRREPGPQLAIAASRRREMPDTGEPRMDHQSDHRGGDRRDGRVATSGTNPNEVLPAHRALGVLPGALVLVTGASGYVGGRLVTVLLERGYRVRCLVRTPAKVVSAPWRTSVEISQGDVGGDLSEALAGVDAAFYLVHSIGSSAEWAEHDRAVAENFRRSAELAGLQRIVYLGGLGDHSSDELSEHLASRQEVGVELAKGSVPVVELRAAVVIGSGSASFEMLRYLVEVLPAMVTPRWVDTKCQPVAIRDVLHFLAESLTADVADRVLDVGGPEVLTYREMMAQYAEVAGLRRRIVVPVPFLTPGLSSRWIGLVTPIPPMLARPLIQSLVNDVIVVGDAASDAMPIEQLSYRAAVELALGHSISGDVLTSWAHAELGGRPPAEPQPTDPAWSGGTVNLDQRERHVAASPSELFQVVCSIGGRQGWCTGDWLWSLRGVLDSLLGGVGMRRGRLHPTLLSAGDPLDFWRVESLIPNNLLRLRAEMRLPGDAWLQWQIEPDGAGATITQTARFHPRGLFGRLYWIAVAPFHRFIFPGLLGGICADAERLHAFVCAPKRTSPDPLTGNGSSDPPRLQWSHE